MAGQASDYHRGEMDIHEQVDTFKLVMNITKWGSLHIATVVLFLVLWFCTEVGFVSAFVTAAVLAVLGFVFLRSKPEAGH